MGTSQFFIWPDNAHERTLFVHGDKDKWLNGGETIPLLMHYRKLFQDRKEGGIPHEKNKKVSGGIEGMGERPFYLLQ